MDVQNACLILVVYFSVITITLIWFCKGVLKLREQKNDIVNKEIIYNSSISYDDTMSDLDNIITSCWQEYFERFLGYKDEEYLHITEDRHSEIVKEFGKMVSERVSPIFMKKLEYFYSRKAIGDLIAGKIYTIVLNYDISGRQESKNK